MHVRLLQCLSGRPPLVRRLSSSSFGLRAWIAQLAGERSPWPSEPNGSAGVPCGVDYAARHVSVRKPVQPDVCTSCLPGRPAGETRTAASFPADGPLTSPGPATRARRPSTALRRGAPAQSTLYRRQLGTYLSLPAGPVARRSRVEARRSRMNAWRPGVEARRSAEGPSALECGLAV